MSARSPILIIGGTRGTGRLIARQLHQRGEPVRVMARDPERARSVLDAAVEVTAGDLTRPDTLPRSLEGARHIVFTAGCRSGRPVREPIVRATEYVGVLDTLEAARRTGFTGRFLYMTSSGVTTPSIATSLLNLWKGNTLVWRLRVEDEIRSSGFDYGIIRTGILLNSPGGRHEIHATQRALPLAIRYRIARADAARVFVAALEDRHASRATFEAVWGQRGDPGSPDRWLEGLRPDVVSPSGV
jgi:uncharacterized protein YbjT (DUF2867 family)